MSHCCFFKGYLMSHCINKIDFNAQNSIFIHKTLSICTEYVMSKIQFVFGKNGYEFALAVVVICLDDPQMYLTTVSRMLLVR